MEIDDKDLLLLHKLIYDPRMKNNGIITSIEITPLLAHDGMSYGLWYRVYFDKIHSESILFTEDIRDKRIKFLIPVGLSLSKEEEQKYQDKIIQDLKEYLGDDFSEDIIMYMPEEERQRQIHEMDQVFNSLYHWDKYSDSLEAQYDINKE